MNPQPSGHFTAPSPFNPDGELVDRELTTKASPFPESADSEVEGEKPKARTRKPKVEVEAEVDPESADSEVEGEKPNDAA